MEDFGGAGLGEVTDEGVMGTLFAEGCDVIVETFGGFVGFGVLFQGLAGALGGGEGLPGAVFLHCEDAEAGVVGTGHFCEVVGFEVIFAVAGEAEAVDLGGFGEGDFHPGFFFGAFFAGGFPDHGAVFAIVGFFDGGAFLKHFRRFGESGAGVFVGEVFAEVGGAEDFEFIDEDFLRTEFDAEFFGGGVWESHVAVGSPVFFPEADVFAEVFTLGIELGVDFSGAFFARVIFLEFGEASCELDALKDGSERVVVLDGDGIELVIVAAGAAHRDSHHRGSDGLHDFVHAIGAGLADGGGFAADGGGGDVGAGDEEAGGLADFQLVSCQLFGDELIVGEVVVESPDDIVTVDPGILSVEVGFGSIGLGPADDVEPMLGPAFAEVGGGELGVEEGGVGLFGIGGVGVLEVGDFPGSGWEAGESDVDAPDEGAGVGGFIWNEAGIFEGTVEEGVNGIIRSAGRSGAGDGLEGPVIGL